MNTPTIVKQKATYEKICEFKTEGNLYFPREDNNGALHVISSTGEVFQFNDSSSDQVMTLNGQPNGLCFDSTGIIYVSDIQSCALYFKVPGPDNNNLSIENVLVKEYDGKSFKGITSLAYNKEDNSLYFADSGNFEIASIAPFDSVIYTVDLETRVLRPILQNLSFVSDIVYDNLRGVIYIAETFMNRIIRIKQHPEGVFNSSVFYQFSGFLGPSALTLDENGNIFVARYDYPPIDEDLESDGLISVINHDGLLIGEMNFPKFSEITGIYISPKKRENMYITAKNCYGVMKVKISSFTSDLDKYEEATKL